MTALSNLAYHPGNADLLAFAEYYRDAYVHYYVNATDPAGAIAGHLCFPEGLAKDWEENGNTASRDALIAIRNYGAGMAWGSAVWVVGSRECAYAILAHVECARLDLVPLGDPYFSKCLGWRWATSTSGSATRPSGTPSSSSMDILRGRASPRRS